MEGFDGKGGRKGWEKHTQGREFTQEKELMTWKRKTKFRIKNDDCQQHSMVKSVMKHKKLYEEKSVVI